VPGVPQVGDRVFTDREYTFTSLGTFATIINVSHFVRAPNDDKRTGNDETMWILSVPRRVAIYLDFYSPNPQQVEGARAWLDAEGWTDCSCGSRIGSAFEIDGDVRGPGKVYTKYFDAGDIVLKGKGPDNSGVYLAWVVNIPEFR